MDEGLADAGELLRIMRIRQQLQKDEITKPGNDVKIATNSLVEKLSTVAPKEQVRVSVSAQSVRYVLVSNDELLAEIATESGT